MKVLSATRARPRIARRAGRVGRYLLGNADVESAIIDCSGRPSGCVARSQHRQLEVPVARELVAKQPAQDYWRWAPFFDRRKQGLPSSVRPWRQIGARVIRFAKATEIFADHEPGSASTAFSGFS